MASPTRKRRSSRPKVHPQVKAYAEADARLTRAMLNLRRGVGSHEAVERAQAAYDAIVAGFPAFSCWGSTEPTREVIG